MELEELMLEIEQGVTEIVMRQLKNEIFKHELMLIKGGGCILSPCIAVDYKWKIINMIRQKYNKHITTK